MSTCLLPNFTVSLPTDMAPQFNLSKLTFHSGIILTSALSPMVLFWRQCDCQYSGKGILNFCRRISVPWLDLSSVQGL